MSGSTTTDDTELVIAGMTCASCANRIERKLNKLPGVQATVNYATEKATIHHSAEVSTDQLLATVDAAGYSATLPAERAEQAAGEQELSLLRRRLMVAAGLSIPVIAMAMVPAWQFPGWQWVSLALASPVVLWAAAPFHRAAWVNLRHAATTMDTLISVGVLAAYLWSVVALTLGSAGEIGMVHPFEFTPRRSDGLGNIYLEAASGVTTFLLAGRYFEKRAKRRAGDALRALLELGAREVTVLRDGVEHRIATDLLVVGDLFVVRPGEKIATDGVVEEGRSAVDASMLTGEPVPVDVHPGSEVIGACLNTSGRLLVRASRVGAETQLAQMASLVEQAQAGKAEVQRLADRVSGVFVPIVIALSAATLGFWLGAGVGVTTAFSAAVAVLIIACPCALGLATPTALMVGTGRGAQLGILISGPEVLEATRRIDTVLLDKTGTVTTGAMTLADVIVAPGESELQVRRLAAAVESASEHPIARAITSGWVEHQTDNEAPLPPVVDFVNREGRGVEGLVQEHRVWAGRPAWFEAQTKQAGLTQAVDRAEAAGHTAVVLGWDDRARGVLVVADTIKDSSAQAVGQFLEMGLEPVLLTGDNERAARNVADQVGIQRVVAEVLPAGKVEEIRRLQGQGRVVAMVGDGINDGPALAQADLGLAMGTGTDVAIQASDLTLVRGDLRSAVSAVRLSRRTLATIKGNLFWAFAYNVLALPLAAAGLLTPMIAGAAMALSSVFVVTNSLRLRRFR